jgi:hypothetical protein
VFTTARYLSLCCARWIQYTPSKTISLRPILILSSHLPLYLESGPLPSGFWTVLYVCLIPPRLLQALSLFNYDNSLWRRVHILKHLIMKFPQPRVTLSLLETNQSSHLVKIQGVRKATLLASWYYNVLLWPQYCSSKSFDG